MLKVIEEGVISKFTIHAWQSVCCLTVPGLWTLRIVINTMIFRICIVDDWSGSGNGVSCTVGGSWAPSGTTRQYVC